MGSNAYMCNIYFCEVKTSYRKKYLFIFSDVMSCYDIFVIKSVCL